METNTYFKAAFQAALPNNILSAEILLVFFSSKDMQFARVILLRTRIVIVQDIQVKTLIAKFIPSTYFIFINSNCKRVAALFLPMPDWKGGNIAQTFFMHKLARLGLG